MELTFDQLKSLGVSGDSIKRLSKALEPAPTPKQLKLLDDLNCPAATVAQLKTLEQARKQIEFTLRNPYATPKQLVFLRSLGFAEDELKGITKEQAKEMIAGRLRAVK